MLKKIEVEAFLKPMGLGMSRPALVMADDSNEYILKNERMDINGTPHKTDSMCLNEMLAYQIGLYLDVPMPEAAIANIHPVFVAQDPEIRFTYRFEPGIYFASKKLAYLENNFLENASELMDMGKKYIRKTWNTFLYNIDNKDKMVNIIAFDLLIGNYDRYGNEGNILVSNSHMRKIFAIDHGLSFNGPNWTQEKIRSIKADRFDYDNCKQIISNIKLYQGRIFRSLCQHIDLTDLENNPFKEIIYKIESISEELIDSWLNNIPIEWYKDKSLQSEYYKSFILVRKNHIRYLVQMMANYDLFDNYQGGTLQWITEAKSNTV